MKFVFPTKAYEQRAIEFIQEFYDHKSEINGTGGLDRFIKHNDYNGWLAKLQADMDLANIPPGRLPAITYFYTDEADQIVGMINVRLALNDFQRTLGGHMGYSVRPAQRRRGYATQMLRGAIDFCASIGINSLILTCAKDNIGSAKAIIANGGVLDEEFAGEQGCIIQRYTI